jgi:hypothetical protein
MMHQVAHFVPRAASTWIGSRARERDAIARERGSETRAHGDAGEHRDEEANATATVRGATPTTVARVGDTPRGHGTQHQHRQRRGVRCIASMRG